MGTVGGTAGREGCGVLPQWQQWIVDPRAGPEGETMPQEVTFAVLPSSVEGHDPGEPHSRHGMHLHP
ncbi:hypothetical protein GCM10010273_13600 [Streptomyces lavendulocolor]